jgi:hypothetical protein
VKKRTGNQATQAKNWTKQRVRMSGGRERVVEMMERKLERKDGGGWGEERRTRSWVVKRVRAWVEMRMMVVRTWRTIRWE